MKRTYHVYIMASRSHRIYVGMTGRLCVRVWQHRTCFFEGSFTARYRINRLVYFEEAPSKGAALARERQIKAWTRAKRVALIERDNPRWRDLAVDMGFPPMPPQE